MRKHIRKFVAIVLTVCTLVFAALPVSAEVGFSYNDIPTPKNTATTKDFTECPWYSESVYYLDFAHVFPYEWSQIQNQNQNVQVLFLPHQSVTRELFVASLGGLANAAGKEIERESDFKITIPEYVSWAVKNGILRGRGAAGLAEKEELTREEMAVMLVRFADYMGKEIVTKNAGNDTKFSDLDMVSAWAKSDMQKACQWRLLKGRKNDGECKLCPTQSATRAEAAQALYNYVNAIDFDLPDYNGGLSMNGEVIPS